MNYNITDIDYIKATRKASRDEEIRLYGRLINARTTIQKSKKAYNRKRDKKVRIYDNV